MKVDVKTIDNRKKGDIELADSVFGIEPRDDVVARVVKMATSQASCGHT